MNQKINVTKSSLPPLEDYIEIIKGIWDTSWMTNSGPLYQDLEYKLKEYFDCENLELFVNGHMALDIAIKAMKLTGEVITTPFTFISTTHAITMNGLTPVFCDIKLSDYTIDESLIEGLITDKTSAILAVHVYGIPCNLTELARLAKKYNLKLIYDAAHAFGVKIAGNSIANYGDMSMFSFHATKVFNTIEGGALVFQDKSLSTHLRNIRNFGIEGQESITEIGLNAKMNEFAAAMGICNLRYIERNILKRKEVTHIYMNELIDCNGIKLINLRELESNDITYNYSYFPVLIDETKTGFTRDELYDELQKNNIYCRKYFFPLVPDCDCYKGRFNSLNLNVAQYVGDRILTLPIYPDLDGELVYEICKIIKSLYLRRKK